MRRLAGAATAVVLAVLGLTGPGAAGATAAPVSEPCAGVTLVVDLGDLPVGADGSGSSVRCGTTTGRALDVLRSAGVALEGTAQLGLAFVCRVDGRPAADEAVTMPDGSTRTELCARTPPANAYWSLWTVGDDGTWRYATTGVGDTELVDGQAFALVYSVGRSEGRPPVVTPAQARAGELPAGWSIPSAAPVAEPGTGPDGTGTDVDGPGPAVVAGLGLLAALVVAVVVLRVRRARA